MKPTVGAALIAAVNRSIGLGGGAVAGPPRAPRPARPAGTGFSAAGGAGRAESAASSGARSTSVDQRHNSIVIGGAVAAAPMPLARSRSAGPSATSRPAPRMNSIATVVARFFTSLRALGAAQPLDQPLQFLVIQPGASLAHVDDDHSPAIRAEAGVVDLVDLVTRR